MTGREVGVIWQYYVTSGHFHFIASHVMKETVKPVKKQALFMQSSSVQ